MLEQVEDSAEAMMLLYCSFKGQLIDIVFSPTIETK